MTGIKSLLSIVVMLLNLIHVFRIGSALYPPLIVSTVILLIPTLLYDVLGLRTGPVRYIVLTLLTFMSGLMYAVLSYHVIIMLILPIVVFCLYCDRGYVIYTTLLSIPVMIASHLAAYPDDAGV